MPYRRHDIALDAVFEPRELIPRDKKITEIFVTLHAGDVQLMFGPDADPIDLTGPISFKPTGSEQRNGLWLRNLTAQAGVIQTIYSVYAGGLDPDVGS